MAHLAGVRDHMVPGPTYGTYGGGQSYSYYHPEDVLQAVAAIADGRVEVEPIWRTDTPEGRQAEYWSRLRLRLTIIMVTAGFVGLPLALVLYDVFVRK
ncbi:hypothetical protein [Kitasatospora sp. NPDC057223]|uniref:hypothetical protein n=1 Tax=Kitasatospora sp. NPDC057223 TaxID=3346055 RepID=UPI00362862A6